MIEAINKSADGIEYVWSDGDDEPTDWEKEAIREYGVTNRSQVSEALEWRVAMDELAEDNEQLSRVMRGKHPNKDKEIGRPRNPPGRGSQNGNS